MKKKNMKMIAIEHYDVVIVHTCKHFFETAYIICKYIYMYVYI